MKKLGIIYIGSRNITLVLAEISPVGYYNIIDELKTPLQVPYCLNNKCNLCNEEVTHILSTIKTYKQLCDSCETSKIFVLTTEAFNEIEENERIVSYIKNELNVDLSVLTSEQEVFYNHLSVSRSLELTNSLIVEISGTTTTLINCNDGVILDSYRLPFGFINLTSYNSLEDRILTSSLIECNYYILKKLQDVPWLHSTFNNIIITGDVGFTIGKIDSKIKKYPLNNFNNYRIDSDSIDYIYNLVKSKNLMQRKSIPGMDRDMAETICASLSVLKKIVAQTNVNEISLCNHTLRDGFLYEYIDQNYDVIQNNLDYSIYNILNSLNCNIQHAEQVYWITNSLFNQLKPLTNLNDNLLNVVKTASMLHDSGISINYQHHHKHSFYTILNSYINDLSAKELLMSAAVAASHRFNNYQLPLCNFSSIISKLDLQVINQIGVMLKIAEGLDRTLVGKVKDIQAKIYDDYVEILLISPYNLDVEIIQALRAREYFKEIFNKDLVVRKI